MTEEDLEQYFFQVIPDSDENEGKPKVVKFLAPPKPVFEMSKSDDPDTIGQITIKAPELTDEQKEIYEK